MAADRSGAGAAIDFVITDLDGTLWSGEGELPNATRSALGELARRGIPVLAATARRSSSVADLFASLHLDLPTLLLNGALGRRSGDREPFHEEPFSVPDALAILEVFSANGLSPCANFESNEWDVVSGPGPSAGRAYLDGVGVHLRMVDDLAEICVSLPVYGFSVAGADRSAALRVVRDHLLGMSRPPEAVLSPDSRIGGWTLDVSPPGVTKWRGVEAFARAHGVDASRTLAIGDGDNDVELLRRAALGVAMGHATDSAKAAARIVLPGGVEAWAKVLDFL